MKDLIKKVVAWRLGILIVAAIAMQMLAFKPTFPYAEQLLEPKGHPLYWSLANFDGVHYIGIAAKGYFAQFTQAFFPLYPILMRWVEWLVGDYILSGYLISHVSFILFLWYLKKLILLDEKKEIAERTWTYYLLFPTSFFFAAVYSESFFMLLVVVSFLAARQKQWLKAGIFTALASATRLFGILLVPALMIELWQQNRGRSLFRFIKTNVKELLSVSVGASGLFWYMWYLAKNFSDALYFLHAQPAFGASRTGDKLILLYQVFWRYTKMIFTVDPTSLLYYTVSQEVILSTIFLLFTILAFKKTRLSYALFGLLAFVMPTLTGTFSSMPRYVLVLFPAFIVLSKITNPKVRFLLFALSALLLAVNIALFTRGYWVA